MVYVDQLFEMDPMLYAGRNPLARQAASHGKQWCHLWAPSSGDINELHLIARKIGLKRAWFQDRPGFPHYDLVPTKREKALSAGAVAMDLKEWIRLKRSEHLTPALSPPRAEREKKEEQCTLAM